MNLMIRKLIWFRVVMAQRGVIGIYLILPMQILLILILPFLELYILN